MLSYQVAQLELYVLKNDEYYFLKKFKIDHLAELAKAYLLKERQTEPLTH